MSREGRETQTPPPGEHNLHVPAAILRCRVKRGDPGRKINAGFFQHTEGLQTLKEFGKKGRGMED